MNQALRAVDLAQGDEDGAVAVLLTWCLADLKIRRAFSYFDPDTDRLAKRVRLWVQKVIRERAPTRR
ncbi:MAG TPA: hypothetical protein VHQ03_07015 [Candidatus Dormibacteraeota bacterium]|nr:hypothetical protein [Candidatus Dormibacteraeota bacterium]